MLNNSIKKVDMILTNSLAAKSELTSLHKRPKSDLSFAPAIRNITNLNQSLILTREEDSSKLFQSSKDKQNRKRQLASLQRTMQVYLHSEAQQEETIK